ncbi:unnamed protein product [Amoebophrya sp. A120]|nr:unnamed protein product [Amoebophrya sp. A120]|eukprot:GSA120T00013854001.1
MPSVLIVCTSAAEFGPEKSPTGVWIEELASPYYAFLDAGFNVTVASLAGGEIPVDAASRSEGFYTDAAKKFDADETATGVLKTSKNLADVAGDEFDAVYLPGGHGCCTDFVAHDGLKACVEKMYASGKVVSACCHGPVGLAQCCKPDGTPLVKDLKVCAFKDTEEAAVGHTEKVAWLLEAKMKELGCKYESADDWNSAAVCDGQLITGQNPQSSEAVAKLIVEALKK